MKNRSSNIIKMSLMFIEARRYIYEKLSQIEAERSLPKYFNGKKIFFPVRNL